MMSSIEILKLSKAIYSEKAIVETIRAFSHLAEIELSVSDDYYICRFSHCRYERTLTMDEFGNYLIDLMNTKGFA
jgi:hypothetical protein